MPLDWTLTLFYASLGISATAAVLFLWLMRGPPEGVRRKAKGEAEAEGENPRNEDKART